MPRPPDLPRQLPGSEKYPVRKMQLTQGHPDIELCDEKVPIIEVIRDYTGSDVPGPRYKTYCPFAAEHPDESELERCFQVYENNTAYCFVHQQRWTPSLMAGMTRKWGRLRAAKHLLTQYGVAKPRVSVRDRHTELMLWVEEQQRESMGDVQRLADQLNQEMSNDPVYVEHEFHPVIREAWKKCMGALDQLAQRRAGIESLRQWYDISQEYLARALTAVQQLPYSGPDGNEEK